MKKKQKKKIKNFIKLMIKLILAISAFLTSIAQLLEALK
nr:MAG TPA: hypothetical protein [Caudoviricetes sp.]